MTHNNFPESKKIEYLDSIRGIAAIFVIFSHCFLWFAPALHTGIDLTPGLQKSLFNSPFTFFYKGSSAVVLFFVLSGYVLSRACLNSELGRDYPLLATKKRYFRLGIPVFFSILISYILSELGFFRAEALGSFSALSHFYTEKQDFLSFTFDSLIGGMIYGNGTFNYVLWSINIEFYGSLFVFAINSVFFGNIKSLRYFSLLCSLILMTASSSVVVYQALFAFGVFLSTIGKNNFVSSWVTKLLTLLMLIISLYLMGYNAYTWKSASYEWISEVTKSINLFTSYKFHWEIILPSFASMMILASLIIDNSLFKILRVNIFRFFGKLSFSMYLIHSFILAIVAPYVYQYSGNGLHSVVISSAVVICLTVIFSLPFYYYIDKASIKISNKIIK